MLIIDDILLSPVTSMFWLFKELHKRAGQEQAEEGTAITRQLSELYMMLETGRITEEEFDAQEEILLDRLDAFNARFSENEPGEVGE